MAMSQIVGKTSLASRKDSMRKALLRLAKNRFHELQSVHRSQEEESKLAAPISPTPNLIIEKLLPHLKLDSSQLLIDLGCGDGRWLLASSQLTQCRSFGIDIDENRLRLANEMISDHSLGDKIQVQRRDVFDFVKNDSELFPLANVFVLYLFRDAMMELGKLLRERLHRQKRHVCLVSIGFELPDWNSHHEERINGVKVYLYKTSLDAK